MKKSQKIQVALTFFFGPLGLLYSNVVAAIALIIGAVGLNIVVPGIGLLIVWIAAMVVGTETVSAHNRKVKLAQTRHDELLHGRIAPRVAAQQRVDSIKPLSWHG